MHLWATRRATPSGTSEYLGESEQGLGRARVVADYIAV